MFDRKFKLEFVHKSGGYESAVKTLKLRADVEGKDIAIYGVSDSDEELLCTFCADGTALFEENEFFKWQ